MSPEQCSSLVVLKEWQDLIAGLLAFLAGLLGFGAAIYAVTKTLGSEERRRLQEFKAITTSLSAEIFQFASRSLLSHRDYILLVGSDGLTIHDLEESTRFTNPVIYPSVAGRIGLLGDRAHDVVLFYSHVQSILDVVERMCRDVAENFRISEKASAAMCGEKLDAIKGRKFTQALVGPENSNLALEKLLLIAEEGAKLLDYLTKGSVDEAPASDFQKAVIMARASWLKRQSRDEK